MHCRIHYNHEPAKKRFLFLLRRLFQLAAATGRSPFLWRVKSKWCSETAEQVSQPHTEAWFWLSCTSDCALQARHSDPDGFLLFRVDGRFHVRAHLSQVAAQHHSGEEMRILVFNLAEVVVAVLGNLVVQLLWQELGIADFSETIIIIIIIIIEGIYIALSVTQSAYNLTIYIHYIERHE